MLQRKGLTGNQLKILAMITMTCDHVGVMLFPHLQWLRIIGRLAMPIYAFMIAEGCRYTRDRKKYLLRLLSLGVLCQAVYLIAMGSLYMCILITFSISVCLINLLDQAEREKNARVILAEVEKNISEMMVDAAEPYQGNPEAMQLRSFSLMQDIARKGNSFVVVPNAVANVIPGLAASQASEQ